MRSSEKRWARVTWWSMPVAVVGLLAAPSVRLPGDDLGIRGFQTPPLSPELALAQTFTMTAPGLEGIEVFPVAAGRPTQRLVQFELYETSEIGVEYQEALVRSVEVPAEVLARTPSYRFAFAPLPISKDRTYRFDLVAPSASGVAFMATQGHRYAGGSLYANGTARWADMVFEAHAPVPSVWALLMKLRATNPVRAYAILVALPAFWLLVGLVIRALPG